MDLLDIRELLWAARWEAWVAIGNGLWIAVAAQWWLGPVFVIAVLTSVPKKIARLLKTIGLDFVRGGDDG